MLLGPYQGTSKVHTFDAALCYGKKIFILLVPGVPGVRTSLELLLGVPGVRGVRAGVPGTRPDPPIVLGSILVWTTA